MAVHLVLDNSDLAKAYDEISDSQFERGGILVEKLGTAEGITLENHTIFAVAGKKTAAI